MSGMGNQDVLTWGTGKAVRRRIGMRRLQSYSDRHLVHSVNRELRRRRAHVRPGTLGYLPLQRAPTAHWPFPGYIPLKNQAATVDIMSKVVYNTNTT